MRMTSRTERIGEKGIYHCRECRMWHFKDSKIGKKHLVLGKDAVRPL